MSPSIFLRKPTSSLVVALYSVCSCLLLIVVYWYLMRQFVASSPIFDEIWKLDVATSSSPFDRITSLHTPLTPGWAYLAKAFLWLCPEPFQVPASRCFAAFWILPAVFLAPLGLARHQQHEPDVILLIVGAVFLGLAQPVQSALTYFNPYLFEVAYAIALLALAAHWDGLGRWGRIAILVFLTATPLYSFAPLFFLPGIYATLFWRTPGAGWRVVIGASALAAIGFAGVLVAFVYGGMKPSNLAALQNFWGVAFVQGSPVGLLKAVGRFLRELPISLLPLRFMSVADVTATPALLVVIWGLILFGYQTLWRLDRRYVGWVLSAAVVAGMVAFLKPWPLTFLTPLNRVNLGWLWPWYFAFGVGGARVLAAVMPGFRGCHPIILIVFLFASWPMIRPYSVPHDILREIFSDIQNTVRWHEPGPVLVFPLHYSTVPYVNYLLVNRLPSQFEVVEIDQQTPVDMYLENIPELLAARKNIAGIWIIVPSFLMKDPLMLKIDGLSLPHFRLMQVTDTQSCQIRRYHAVR